ncbi:Uncharacterised protein [Starkeya nomas]|uniref:N-acetyltransferase domain-containing protein n=1 Tax=Starkeya nomas TaxID=2666134 RepID=A0A5S9NDQ1_9HYPH|nr:N-acetyltransferase [Starkeya nomas]CAA0088464.1 Uncharacterised protein [Starkeya nomas]
MDIRPETAADRTAVHALNRAAFGQPVEADLVDRLQADGDVVLSLVAVEGVGADEALLGHVLLSRMAAPLRALALGPLAVRPDRQRQGIGAALVHAAIDHTLRHGWQAIFVLGEPNYYRRFGFDAGLAAGFASPYAGPYFMALALDGDLPTRTGDLRHAPAFADLG